MPLRVVPPRKGKSPYYYIRGTYLGVTVNCSARTRERRLAARILRRLEQDIEIGQFARPGEPTFLSAAVAYMETGGEKRFIGPLLKHFGRSTLLKQVDQEAIDRAAMALYPNATPATRNRQVHTVVSAILKHAGIDVALRRPKGAAGKVKTDWLWPEQAFRLFDAAEAIDAEFARFLVFLCYTGTRLSEALTLNAADVRLAESFAFVRTTKNGEPRPVFLPPVVVADLANADLNGKVFRFRKNGRLYSLLAKARKATGPDVDFVTFHTFRHTWATWMRRYGNLDTRGLVGTRAWSDPKSAARYEHVVVSEEAMKAIHLPTRKAAK